MKNKIIILSVLSVLMLTVAPSTSAITSIQARDKIREIIEDVEPCPSVYLALLALLFLFIFKLMVGV